MRQKTVASPAAGLRLFGVALLCVSAVFAFVLTRPLQWLLGVVPDDAFYYLSIARHLADTGASTFDGLNPTNGYHPGWMAVLAVCAKIFVTPVALLRSALVAAFCFHVAASVCLSLALPRWMSPNRAWAAGALWLLNLLPVRLALQGMEASFYIFGLSVALLTYSRRLAGPRPPANADFALFGLSLSVCFWGRTEASVLAMWLVALLGWSLRGSRWLGALFVTAAAFIVGIAPWFVYSRVATGSFVQHSGAMKMLWAADAPPPLPTRAWQALHYLLGNWISFPLLGGLTADFHGLRGLVDAAGTLCLVALLWFGWKREATRRASAVACAIFVGTMLTGGIYATLFSDMQFWYKAQPGFVLYVVSFGCVAEFLASRWPARGALVAGGLAAVFGLILIAEIPSLASYPWQRDVFESEQRFDQIVPQDQVIGCFNAGIPGYFSKHTIVNLDGLVNNTIYEYYRARRVDAYLRDAHVSYLADEVDALGRASRFMQQRPNLTELASAPLNGWISERRYLWRVGWSAEVRSTP